MATWALDEETNHQSSRKISRASVDRSPEHGRCDGWQLEAAVGTCPALCAPPHTALRYSCKLRSSGALWSTWLACVQTARAKPGRAAMR